MCAPMSTVDFVGFRSATRTALGRVDKPTDFPGCYVFLRAGTAIYVGISRGVVNRIIQHINSDTHYSASLVYRMACNEHPHKMRRDEAMKHDQFRTAFFSVQNRLREMSVAFIEIHNDLELYLFEVYAAMKLHTVLNTFRTH